MIARPMIAAIRLKMAVRMIDRILIGAVVALTFGLIVTVGLWHHERGQVASLRDKLARAEQQLEAARVNREAIRDLDKGQREVSREIDQAIRRSTTVSQAVDEIERMEGRE